MVSNETWAGVVALNLRYTVHCEPCERMVDIDAEKMPPDGPALNVTFRCSQCGRPGRTTVSHKSAEHAYPGSKPPRRFI